MKAIATVVLLSLFAVAQDKQESRAKYTFTPHGTASNVFTLQAQPLRFDQALKFKITMNQCGKNVAEILTDGTIVLLDKSLTQKDVVRMLVNGLRGDFQYGKCPSNDAEVQK